nr:hypothetical protein [Tanacetum cinerariifolium]
NLTNTLALLTQSYRTFLPQTNNQLRTSSNTRNQATVQDGRVVVQNVQRRPNRGQGMNPRGGQDNAFDDDVDEQPVQDLALNVDNVFQADDCDAFDSDVDEAPTAQTMLWPICHPQILVAIGYKNPLCLTRAKQVQHALYNGHEIIKDNYKPTIVHDTKDTLEIAEITRKKMNDKMNDPECVTRNVKISPHDYSKENFLATFTPQKQLTPEQIFWSNGLMKLKSKALKERTKVSRPIKAFTV